jgi:thiamine biosynthesis lipoprotein
MLEAGHWRALGTNAHLFVLDGDLASARAAVEALLDDVDSTYSRFRDDSELSRLQTGPGRWAHISPLLWQAVTAAIAVARDTDGAVDPTIGRAMRAIGYDRDFARLGTVDERVAVGDDRVMVVELAPVPGWRAIGLDANARTIRIPRGVELDLGSSGKALAVDLAVRAAATAAPGGGVLVSLGGDLSTAGRAPAGGWRILAGEDSETDPDSTGEVVAIASGAIATSGTTIRRWRGPDGIERHHLLDPSTGAPVDGPWRTVTVVADTCVAANAASTAAIVLGDEAVDWLSQRSLPARLVGSDGRIVRLGGWPEPIDEAVA